MTLWGNKLKNDGYLKDPKIIEVFNHIDRKDFLPDQWKNFSEMDEPIELAMGQTQSAPHMDAIMAEWAKTNVNDDVLEIGTGSGYFTTILSFMASKVLSVEYFEEMIRWAKKNISKYKRDNIELVGCNINDFCIRKKFDLIISTASFSKKPTFLYALMKQDARLIYPIGSYPPQRMIYYRNRKEEIIADVAFVPIIY
ncbi:MAG: methyltransferase domain-containing protein [Candidatus Thermoplasmatota archaeon]|nr:methyltransferase domain-containing protein [Candidatus Thermoplasmatota archaeon]